MNKTWASGRIFWKLFLKESNFRSSPYRRSRTWIHKTPIRRTWLLRIGRGSSTSQTSLEAFPFHSRIALSFMMRLTDWGLSRLFKIFMADMGTILLLLMPLKSHIPRWGCMGLAGRSREAHKLRWLSPKIFRIMLTTSILRCKKRRKTRQILQEEDRLQFRRTGTTTSFRINNLNS